MGFDHHGGGGGAATWASLTVGGAVGVLLGSYRRRDVLVRAHPRQSLIFAHLLDGPQHPQQVPAGQLLQLLGGPALAEQFGEKPRIAAHVLEATWRAGGR